MKKTHKVGLALMVIGFSIWILETIIFLIIEGWHYKAVSQTEIAFDLLSIITMKIGFFLWMVSAAWIVNTIYKEGIVCVCVNGY